MKKIYYNGVVYKGCGGFAQAFAVEDGSFVFTGTSEEALGIKDAEEYIDLRGRFVCPGFNESHMHILNYGQSLMAAELGEHTDSLEDMLQCLADFEKANPRGEGEWLIGRGFNHDYFSDVHRLPTRWDLDRVSRSIPIIATRCCGHVMVVNSRAIELLGIDADVPQPEGGRIGIENGEPDGRFFDNAMAAFDGLVTVPDRAGIKQMIKLACRALNSNGVTSAHSDDYQTFGGIDWRTVKSAYEELEASGELSVRVYEQSNFTSLDELKAFIAEGNNTGTGSAMFKTGPLKMVADGSLGARTAYLSRPYADAPEETGFPCYSQEQLDGMIGYAHANGMQTAVHAIGDACLDMVLQSVEKALAEHPREDHRHGIVHCQITRPEQLRRIAELNMHVFAQTIFLDYDNRIVKERVGDELASSSYSWKTLMNSGVSVSNGSDCPVETAIPMRGIQCAVTRECLSGGEAYLPEQAFSLAEAIDSYTIGSARGAFEERFKGLIAPGYFADFVVLGSNPFCAESRELKDIPVLETYLGGRRVFKKA